LKSDDSKGIAVELSKQEQHEAFAMVMHKFLGVDPGISDENVKASLCRIYFINWSKRVSRKHLRY
jgi:hypothetical protein